jgi:hypothetical protein
MVAGRAGKNPGLEIEAQRLGAQYGLGQCTGSWDVTRVRGRVVFGGVLLIVLAVGWVIYRTATSPSAHVTAGGAGFLFAAAAVLAGGAAVLMMAIPPRSRRVQVFLYEGGMARVSNLQPRLTVLPWADLDTISVEIVEGYDDTYVGACVLRDRSGNKVMLGSGERGGAREAIMDAAQRVLASRLAGPLTRQLDAGQPVTFGTLTIDLAGISSRGGPGGRWHVPWQQVHRVQTSLHGQRVRVVMGRWKYQTAKLDDVPNSFLAQHVIAHAAQRAGVPVSAG